MEDKHLVEDGKEGSLQGKYLLIHRRIWKDNIKINCKESGYAICELLQLRYAVVRQISGFHKDGLFLGHIKEHEILWKK